MHHVSPLPEELLATDYPAAPPRRRRFSPELGEVRCECAICGSHAFANPAVEGSGRCGNCGSMELRPIEAGAG